MDIAEGARRFSSVVVAREVLVDVAQVLAAHRIEVMPLKGILLRELAYLDPGERELVDVDVAVRSGDFETARTALVSAGYRVELEQPSRFEVSLRRGRSPLSVDLHRRLSATRRFRLSIDAMFARGRADTELFGVRVVVPDDYDVFAHLLAHTALHYANDSMWHRPEDLGRFARARNLDAARCARHLETCGLSRFARVTLVLLAREDDRLQEFAHDVLRNLRPDPIADVVASAVRAVYERRKRSQLLLRVVGVLMNPTLGDVALALAGAAASRTRLAAAALSSYVRDRNR